MVSVFSIQLSLSKAPHTEASRQPKAGLLFARGSRDASSGWPVPICGDAAVYDVPDGEAACPGGVGCSCPGIRVYAAEYLRRGEAAGVQVSCSIKFWPGRGQEAPRGARCGVQNFNIGPSSLDSEFKQARPG